MRIRAKKPAFSEIDGEYVVAIRLSEDLTHSLLSGWHPIGFGWGCLRPRDDGTFDLFIRQRELSEDLNLVKLDTVRAALIAALDLAVAVENESYVSGEVESAAQEVKRLVSVSAEAP